MATALLIGLLQCHVVKGRLTLLKITGRARRAFNGVHISQTQSAKETCNMLKQCLWRGIACIVGRGDGRNANAAAAAPYFLAHGQHHFF